MKEIKLYNGKITIFFDEARHIFYHEDKKTRIDGVTSATSKLDKSAPLMGWAVKMMGIYLINNWDLKKIKTDSQKVEIIETAKKEFRRLKIEAADIGSEIHKWCELWIKGKKPEIPEGEKARNGVIAFLKWIKEKNNLKITESERFIYSKKYDYAGIMDWEGVKEKELVIGDFKSSKGIYNEMLYQLSAYWNAREEEANKKYDKGYIIQFGKEDGEFHTLEIPRKEHIKNLKAFVSLLQIKRREGELARHGK